MPLTLLLTCAGKSTRYPGYRPKWSLTHPLGMTMAVRSLQGLAVVNEHVRIVAAFRASDVDRFGEANILHSFSEHGVQVEIANVGETDSHVETVVRALEVCGVEGPFVTKDCDNYFEVTLSPGNWIGSRSLMVEGAVHASNKSYVVTEGGWVVDIAERRLLSERFCVGVYSFASARQFCEHATTGVGKVSEVIKSMLATERFGYQDVEAYEDWGTASDWKACLHSYKTLFVDVDGVLVESSHRSFEPRWGESKVILANVDYLNRLHATGKVHIVLTTARPDSFRSATEQQLRGLRYDRLLMGFPNCARYIVNDYSAQRGEHTCFAVNLERDSELLEAAFARSF